MEYRRSEAVGGGPRGFVEIVYSILSVSLNGTLRTHIMFRCNLNSRQLHTYLEALIEKGLLERKRDPPSSKVEYITTVKGRKYIEAYDVLAQMLVAPKPVENETIRMGAN
ncbi:MAG TPA: winged helix-turn-helix domain-containing protein [Nitrososphaerales archaeon]|nr:winged helix-turn-helix domain-containing protein [Nitrososphaerales archaeon]